MAAATLKSMKWKQMSIAFTFTAVVVVGIPLYCIFTLVSLRNDCKNIPSKSSFSSSVFLRRNFEQFQRYFLNIFNLGEQQSCDKQPSKWSHQDVTELCNQDIMMLIIFVMTSQLGHDAGLFIFELKSRMASISRGLSDLCKRVLIFCNNQLNSDLLVYFSAFLISLILFCGAVIYYKKSKTLTRNSTIHSSSYCGYNYNSNSSLAVASARTPVSLSRPEYEPCIGRNHVNHHNEKKQISISAMCLSLFRWLLLLTVVSIFLSIPWEFIRLYQKAVAHRAANINMGLPVECNPDSLRWTDSVKSLLKWHLSWSHDHNPCIDYYHSLLVNPVWEVSPLLVLSSVLSRGIVHPLEIISSSLGRSVRIFFAEIPAHWQPALMVVSIVMLLVLLLILCSYRVSIPLLLRIEPRTPVTSPSHRKSRVKVEKKGPAIRPRATKSRSNTSCSK